MAHPGITFLGGASRNRIRDRREDKQPNEVVLFDAWTGIVHHLYDRRSPGATSRPLVVPALRFLKRDYRERPVATVDSNRIFHQSDLYLAGLFFQRLDYYKTSYLLGFGETESVPRGVVMKVTGGYQDGEFLKRACLFLDTGAVFLRDRGDIYFGSADWGGFFRNDPGRPMFSGSERG